MGDGFRGCLDLWIIGMDQDHELGSWADLLWMFFFGCMKTWTQCWRWGCSVDHEGRHANWFSSIYQSRLSGLYNSNSPGGEQKVRRIGQNAI